MTLSAEISLFPQFQCRRKNKIAENVYKLCLYNTGNQLLQTVSLTVQTCPGKIRQNVSYIRQSSRSMPSAFILICIYTQHFLESNYIRKLVLYNILLLISQLENLRIYRIYTLHIRDINLYISFVKLNPLFAKLNRLL